MAGARYFLADAVLTALFALRDQDCRQLLATFDQIADSPHASAISVGHDWDGRLVYLARHGRFEIGHVIASEAEMITITLLRPRPA
ncbi:MAG: hypothetical protein ABJF10_23825 [Chthoniobacter sp.]|uniref:hypothetical protein n=1 Tax=Chthoniobacter sp. TaxID=2510640 RepID=UPI0032A4093A